MKCALAILGGSTPFTAALVEALRKSAVPPCELRLFGLDGAALDRMRRYAERRLRDLGWAVAAFRRLDQAVDGAEVVVNQIRFGGLSGRSRDENMAARWGVPADETLGPCGLIAALRVANPIRALAAELGRRCPHAWVVNLANPLSVTTKLMAVAGAPARCFGVCELPLVTALEVCRLLRCSPNDVQWKYAGLNHRGVLFSFRHRGEELLPRLPELLGEYTVFGITAEEIRSVGALPLKYFALTRAGRAPIRRADFLIELKAELARQIDDGEEPPRALTKRGFEWYAGALVPALAAILSETPTESIVNLPSPDGLVREMHAAISRSGVRPQDDEAPLRVHEWLRPWEDHEHAVLEAVGNPSLDAIERALELDPLVPSGSAARIAREIWTNHEH